MFGLFKRRAIRHLLSQLAENPQDSALAQTVKGHMEKSPGAFTKALRDHAEGTNTLFKVLHDPQDREDLDKQERLERRFGRKLTHLENVRERNAPKPGKRRLWKNDVGNQQVRPMQLHIPKSLKEIQALVKEAEKIGARIRAYGSRHSSSDVAITNGFMIDTTGFSSSLELNKSWIKPEYQNNRLYEAEAGITIAELTYALGEIDWALPNMGGSNIQTFMGAASTATHGSGITLGSYADIIRSLVLVTSGGKTYRIEPTNGITDPTAYNAVKQGIELVQDDDWFYSVVCSMGCAGIVYSVIIEVDEFYYLNENRTLMPWSQLKNELRAGKYINEYRNFEVLVNPYQVKGENTCVLVKRNPVGGDLGSVKPSGHRNILETILAQFKWPTELIIAFLNLFPETTPGVIEKAVKGQKDHDFKNTWFKVLNQGLNQVKNFGTAIEIGFPVDNHVYIDAVDEIIKVLATSAEHGKQFIQSPLGVRFVAASDAYMSMMYKQDTCMIELPVLYKVKGGMEVLQRAQEELYKLGGRPHWGLQLDRMTAADDFMQKLYPKADTFISVVRKLNDSGVFDNAFSDRVGFSKIPLGEDL